MADAWTPPNMAGRGDTFFDWHALALGGANGTETQRIRDWARLLASVGINGLAPQDVNYDERDNFLSHLDVLPALGEILRKWNVKLFWCPNYFQAPLQTTADALFKAVPDFGGYLLKIGSEKQASTARLYHSR